MDVVAWVATALLGVILLPAGLMKVSQPPAALVDKGLAWVAAFPPAVVKLIGGLELLAVVGLVLPPLVDVAAFLAIAAAIGVVALMAGAMITHARRGENKLIGMNVVVAALAVVVVVARLA